MCEVICLVKSYVIVKLYVKQNIISDAISNIYVKRDKYSKRGKDGIYMLAEQNNFKKAELSWSGMGYKLLAVYFGSSDHRLCVFFPSLYLGVSESHIA